MKISTKGRYALRVIIDLAGQQRSGYVPLKEIAVRQGISLKYLESIMTILSKRIGKSIPALLTDWHICRFRHF